MMLVLLQSTKKLVFDALRKGLISFNLIRSELLNNLIRIN